MDYFRNYLCNLIPRLFLLLNAINAATAAMTTTITTIPAISAVEITGFVTVTVDTMVVGGMVDVTVLVTVVVTGVVDVVVTVTVDVTLLTTVAVVVTVVVGVTVVVVTGFLNDMWVKSAYHPGVECCSRLIHIDESLTGQLMYLSLTKTTLTLQSSCMNHGSLLIPHIVSAMHWNSLGGVTAW